MTLTQKLQAATVGDREEVERPAWADCPAFHNVWCHAPWACKQPCIAALNAKGLTDG